MNLVGQMNALQLFKLRCELMARLHASTSTLDVGALLEVQKELSDLDAVLAKDRPLAQNFHSVCTQHMWTHITKEQVLKSIAEQRATLLSTSHVVQRTDVAGTPSTLERAVDLPLQKLMALASFDDLVVSHRLVDSYIVCRVISQAVPVVGITFVAEDLRGKVMFVAVYNFPIPHTVAAVDALFRPGLVFAIKAPLLKLASQGWNPLLRCNHELNFVPLHDRSDDALRGTSWFEPPCAAAVDWKLRGNDYAKNGWLRSAIACYTRGLALEASSVDLLANRAEMSLRLGEWQAALDDASAVLAQDPAHKKCAVRAAKSLARLGRYGDAVQAWLRAAALFDVGSVERGEFSANSAKALTSLRQTEGVFSWDQLFAAVVRKTIEVATYLNSSVHVDRSTAIGRGLVCRVPLAKGALILVERALASADNDVSFTVEWSRKRASNSQALYDAVFSNASSDSVVRAQLRDLSAADHADVSVGSSLGAHVKAACDTCSWGFSSCIEFDEVVSMSAVFYYGSLFNHSCMPNCSVSHVGDVMIVQALQEISAGDQLFVAYCPTFASLEERREALKARSFECRCERCAAEGADVTYQRLVRRLDELKMSASAYKDRSFLALGAEIEANENASRTLFWRQMAAKSAEEAQDLPAAVKWWTAALKPHIDVNVIYRASADQIARSCLKLAHLCMLAEPKNHVRWLEKAKEQLKISTPPALADLIFDRLVESFSKKLLK